MVLFFCFFFFFKQKTAYEITRTGVQTCALPIFLLERSNDPLTCKVGRTDLMWCVRHDLPALEDASLDELANPMMADTELCSSIAQRQPVPIIPDTPQDIHAAYM